MANQPTPPRIRRTPPRNSLVYDQAFYENHWFPLIRPAKKKTTKTWVDIANGDSPRGNWRNPSSDRTFITDVILRQDQRLQVPGKVSKTWGGFGIGWQGPKNFETPAAQQDSNK